MLKKYYLNCFLLLIPLFLWNIIWVDFLPEGYSAAIFWKDIPLYVVYGENILRIVLFVLPAIMVLSIKSQTEKIGLVLYLFGLALYFSSWLLQIFIPYSNWSQSLIGFMAPAFSTFVFFIGIGLIGNKAFFKFPYLSQLYIVLSILFVFFHSAHTYIVYTRL